MIQADGASANFTTQFPQGVPGYSRRENKDTSSPGMGRGGIQDLRNKLGPVGPEEYESNGREGQVLSKMRVRTDGF